MRYFIVVGEKSGDIHASYLLKQIKAQDADATFRFYGGEAMAEAVGKENQLCGLDKLNFMGFADVVRNFSTIYQNLKNCKAQILNFNPEVVLLVDYPGFNLKIAKFCKENKIKTAYFIAPKVWVWKQKRVHKIKAFVNQLYVIFPFEKPYFEKYEIPTEYFGNPLVEQLANRPVLEKKQKIALLPGSRPQEIKKILPMMLKAVEPFSDYEIEVGAVSSISADWYQKISPKIKVTYDNLYEVVGSAKVAIVCSGTATLETALIGTPQVVGYITNWITYKMARLLIKGVNHISLVNILLKRTLIQELIQADFNEKKIREEVTKLIEDKIYQSKITEGYQELRILLGETHYAKPMANHIINKFSKK